MHSLLVGAPEPLKAQLRGMNLKARVRVCARFSTQRKVSSVSYAKQALRRLARRYQVLDTEIAELDVEIRRLCAKANPALSKQSDSRHETDTSTTNTCSGFSLCAGDRRREPGQKLCTPVV